jgi:cytochrome P450
MRWLTVQVPTILGIHDRLGDIATIRFAGGRGGVITRSPEDIKALFTASPELVPTATANSPIGPFVGRSSLLTLNGPEHLRHRKLLLPPFHGDRMRGYADDIASIATEEIDRWRVGEQRPLQPAMQSITLEVILRIVFGVDDAARQDQLRRAIVQLLGLTERPALLIPTFFAAVRRGVLIGPVKRYAEEVDQLIYREIELRRGASDLEQRTDVLSMLLTARDEDGNPMTAQELRDELVTVLFAGHETTASALAWTFERLVRTPAAMDLATDAACGEDPDGVLDAVFQESLRLRPVVPVTARALREPFVLSGYEIPAGTLVVISIVGVNQHPDRFDDPAVFRPERFVGEKPDTYAWIPFGGGVRRCIGAAFAQLEGRIVLREVLRRATLTAVDPADERRKRRNVTTVPGNGALVRIASLT